MGWAVLRQDRHQIGGGDLIETLHGHDVISFHLQQNGPITGVPVRKIFLGGGLTDSNQRLRAGISTWHGGAVDFGKIMRRGGSSPARYIEQRNIPQLDWDVRTA